MLFPLPAPTQVAVTVYSPLLFALLDIVAVAALVLLLDTVGVVPSAHFTVNVFVVLDALVPLYVNVPLVSLNVVLPVALATLALNVELADLCVSVADTDAVIVISLLVALTGVNVLPLTVTYDVFPLLIVTAFPHELVAVNVFAVGYVNATTLVELNVVEPSLTVIGHAAFAVVNVYVLLHELY